MSQILSISPNAVFEAFDDEVVVINMLSGSYYALDAVALRVWNCLQQPQTLGEVALAMQSCYRGESAAIEAAVREFVEELVREDLIIQVEGEIAPAQPDAVAAVAAAVAERAELPEFRKPEISKFTDMEDLLLLDPIHEVDAAGWPNAKNSDGKGDA